jgi:gluconolactonase
MPHLLALLMVFLAAAASADVPAGEPGAVIDLMTADGAELVQGTWRYSDTRIIQVDFPTADAAGQPTGAPARTYDYEPHAGGRDFDDSGWMVVGPETLSARRAAGKLSFNWYRIRIRIPAHVGDFDTSGSLVVFETSLDDYAEIWVDGELTRAFGQSGGSVIAGWNADNRLIVGRGVKPGQEIQLAVFGINGPISAAPTNYIYVRHARLSFYSNAEAPVAQVPREVNVEVERRRPEINALIPENAKAFKLAEGFAFTEGPVWSSDGFLLFSDPNENRIYRFEETPSGPGRLSVFRDHSGYTGADVARYSQPGSNGLAIDPQGNLAVDEHGNRRVTRTDKSGAITVIADHYRGKRLNSPNDLIYKSDGSLYFTDPPFGLPLFFDDPDKELPFSGVYRVSDDGLQLLANDLTGPNGIAFSPDEQFLYVSNWDEHAKVVMQYPVRTDGSLGPGNVLFDMKNAPEAEALDGLKVDERGNLYVSGPGGVWVLSPRGEHLGTIRLPRLPANFTWGGADGRTLYLTARDALYRMPLKVAGATAQRRITALGDDRPIRSNAQLAAAQSAAPSTN